MPDLIGHLTTRSGIARPNQASPDLIGHLTTKQLQRHPFKDVSFFVGIFPSRKTAFVMDADLKNSFSSRKTPLFMDRIIYMQCSIRKTPCFTDGALKFARLIRNLAEFTDRTTFHHPMRNLLR